MKIKFFFARGICPSVRPSVPTFHNIAKQNKFIEKIVITTDGAVGLALRIIDGKHVF